MGNPQQFLDKVRNFKGEEIEQTILDAIGPIIDDPGSKFNEEDMKKQSFPASKLCAWAVNIREFNRIYKIVKPLKDEVERATADLEAKQKKLAIVKERVRVLNAKVTELKRKLEEAEARKKIVEDDAARCQDKLTAAEKLVNGLAGENKRWGENVITLQENILSVIGDVLLASAFVSYIGAFSAKLRKELWSQIWLPDIIARKIPITEGIEPLKILTTES